MNLWRTASSVLFLLACGLASAYGQNIFLSPLSYAAEPNTHSIAVADFNGDGNLDVAVANQCVSTASCTTGSVSVFLGNGDGTFQAATTYTVSGANTVSVAVGDLNGDGKPDLVVASQCATSTSCSGGTVSVFLNNGNGTFPANPVVTSTLAETNSVAIGDFNGDGKADLAYTSSCFNYPACSNGALVVALGNRDGTFGTQTSLVTRDVGTNSVAIADFNGDSKLDLAFTTCASSFCADYEVVVMLGNGDGTFQSGTAYPLQFNARNLVVADFNADGYPDLAVANLCSDSTCANGSVSVLLNSGSNGTFQPAVNNLLPPHVQSLAAGNFNGDGKPDLAVVDPTGTEVLLGNGDGTFQPPLNYAVGGTPFAVASGNFNNDLNLDLAVANECLDNTCTSGAVSVLLGNGNGTFQAALDYPVQRYPLSVAASDVNGDGTLDLAVANECIDSSCDGSVSVLLGNTNGTFQSVVSYPVQRNAQSVAVSDFNNDGKPDLAVANQCVDKTCATGSVSILLGNGDGTFQPAVSYPVQHNTQFVTVGDFNSDGNQDLAVVNQCSDSTCVTGSISVLLGNGDGTFKPATSYPIQQRNSQSVAVGDFNSDGNLDLAVVNSCVDSNCDGSISILLGNGDGTFQTPVNYAVQINAVSVAVGDFNGNGQQDLAVVNECASSACANGSVSVLLGNGNGTFQAAVNYPVQREPLFVAIADPNGDGNQDLVVANNGSNNVSVLLGNGDGTFQAALNYTVGNGPSGIAVGDYNQDGKPDLAVCNVGGNNITVLLNLSSSGRLSTSTAVVASANPSVPGQSITFTATVTHFGPGTPTGSVNFNDGATTIGSGTLNSGQAVFTTSTLSSGIHLITASYTGDANFLASTSPQLREHILPAPTTTSLSSSLNPSTYGQSVTLTATVSSSVGTPTGTVSFTDATNLLGTATLSGGQARLSTTLLAAGLHSITAAYGGNASFGSSTSTALSQQVNQATSSVAVSSNINPSYYEESVTFTATITPQFGGAATGTVTFLDGAAALGTVPVVNNAASLATSSLKITTHSITATYSGDTNVSGSTSPVLSQKVTRAPTTTTLTSSPNPALYLQTITFTATVSSPIGTPTGTVTFKEGTVVLGTGILSGGVASLQLGLPVGKHFIQATYGGAATLAASTSKAITQQVSKAGTTTALISSQNPSVFGQPVTFTATVAGQFGGTPTGTITFHQGTNVLGTVNLTNGQASLTTSSLNVGTFSISGTYSGDSNFIKSTSHVLRQQVTQAATTTTLVSSQNPSTSGQNVTFTATVSSSAGTPTGTVTFMSGTTPLGTVPLTSGTAAVTQSFTTGTYAIQALYNGTTNFQTSSASLSQQVD
jgi:hypothetical protein